MTKKEGKRGGHTRAIAILRNPCLVDLREYRDRPALYRLLKRLREERCGDPVCKDKSKEWLYRKLHPKFLAKQKD